MALPLAGWWLTHVSGVRKAPPVQAAVVVPATRPFLRLGYTPETNIFAMRKGYRALAGYLEQKLAARRDSPVRVELVTATSYAEVLRDFSEGRIDAAFMGSLSALVAVDRHEGQVYLKSQGISGQSTYSGVIFVRETSPCMTFEDLRGKRLGAVRTTMGGAVFPLYLMTTRGMLPPAAGTQMAGVPQLVWSGTHDDVIKEVVAGHLDGGAVKDLRLLAYEQEHPQVRFRRLAESSRVPDNALVIRADYPAEQRAALVSTLLAMNYDPRAKDALAAMKVARYLPCQASDYSALHEMVSALGPHWKDLNIASPPPKRPPRGEGG